MKNPVAPIECAVQFISPPSDIVDVDRQSNRQAIIESQPKEFND
jgi:hypothetical protein